jgi:hypothetical protein
MRFRFVTILMLLGATLAGSTTAGNAYVGPGAGLSAVGSLLSVVAALLFAVVGFIWYPLKRLFRRGKGRAAAGEAAGGVPPGR